MAFPAIASVLGSLGKTGGSGGISGALGVLNVLSQVDAPLKILTNTFKSFISVVASPIEAINSLGHAVGNLTRLANPGQFQRFTLVMNDAFAALGKSMEPLMESLITIGKMIGDTFAALQPTLTPLMAALGQLSIALAGALLPAVQLLVPYLQYLTAYWVKISEIITALISPMRKFVEILLDIFGVTQDAKRGFDPSRSAAGSAVRNFKFSSSGDDLQKENAIKAFSNGQSIQEQVNAAQVSLPKIMNDILTAVKNGVDIVDKFISALSPKSDKQLSDLGLDSGAGGRIEAYLAQLLYQFRG
jgi:phage-related protein